jgi:membrane-associated phospholipid phosphatase
MPAHPLVARSWRPWCVAALIAALVLVAALGVALHDRRSTTGFDNWAARPLFHHISERGGTTLLALSASPITLGALAIVALGGALIRDWELVALAVVGPAVAVVGTEFVLKPLVHRQITHAMADNAFPSGHETGLASMLVVLLLLIPRARLSRRTAILFGLGLALWAALGAAGLVRAHWHVVTDTIGGVAVGIACVLAAALLIDALSPRMRRRKAAAAAQFT